MVVCITGMHRSGTSMIARLLNLSGVYLGHESDLIAAAADNPEGFWENKNFLNINEEILAKFGGSWDTPPVMPESWHQSDQLQDLRARAQELIEQFSGHENWGWKDPRASLTIPFWRDLIPDLKVVVCLRNPLEVAQSFYRRGYSSNNFSFQLWHSYSTTLMSSLSAEDHIITHYESYFINSNLELRRLLDFLEIPVTEKKIEETCRTISLTHKHNRSMLDDVIDAQPSAELMRMYIGMCLRAGEVYWGKFHSALTHSLPVVSNDWPEISQPGLLLRLSEKSRLFDRVSAEHDLLSKMMKTKDKKIVHLTRAEYELRSLQDSLVVKLLYRYRRIVDRLLPESSLARKIYDRSATLIRIFAAEGVRGFWNRFQARWRNWVDARNSRKSSRRADRPVKEKIIKGSLQEKLTGIYTDALAAANGKQKVDYIPLSQDSFSSEDAPVKLISFYLPQFHPIPENDDWWGRGFTEWSNVSKAVPQYTGHYQPHLPGELGFYDLRLPEVQRRQVELAKQYGIHGFSFYYYWFNGKRLLERPLDQFVSDPEIDFPFCLCWANENWTRRWDGQESEVLIGQNHSAESDFAFIKDIAPYLRHKNYIKVEDRPVLIVYRPQIMPDPIGTAKRWRQYCKENGLGDIYLVAAQAFHLSDPHSVGFDAAVEFPPHGIAIPEVTKQVDILNPNYDGKVYNYQHVAGYMMQKMAPTYPLFRTVMPSWDNTARRQNHAHIFINANPSTYEAWLSHTIQYTRQNLPEKERFIFVNAWNEWAEGAHLEPDRKYGYAYLQSTMNALRSSLNEKNDAVVPGASAAVFEKIEKEYDTAVILHIYYPELWDEINSYLNHLNGQFDLFVSISETVKFDTKRISDRYPQAHIYRCKNQGRDIAPFIQILKAIYTLNYQYVCKIHTKKTTHRENGEQWRKDLLTKLLGSSALIAEAKKKLDSKLNIGLLAPKGHLLSSSQFIAENEKDINWLARKAEIPYEDKPDFDFIAGSMFWFKPLALSTLVFMDIANEDFGVEKGLKDGTLAHAFERFIGLLALKSNFDILEIGQDTKDSPRYNFAAPMHGSFRKLSRNPIIVYQMGKVGSMSVVISLQKAFKQLDMDVPVHHRHVLNNLDEIEQAIRKERPNPDETLAEIQEAKKIMAVIKENPNQRWNLISLVRDPVARNVATFFQNLPEIVPEWKESAMEGTLDVVALQKTFLNMKSIHAAPDSWFDTQLKPIFGLDVYQTPFPVETGYKIYKGPNNADLLVIRLEDLNTVAQNAIYEFLGLNKFKIIHTNTTESKEYAKVYDEFKKLPLPSEYLERVYTSKLAQHFYTEEELNKFAARWRTGA